MRRYRRFRDSPESLDLSGMNWQKALVVVAHPDDEIFCSGLICELINSGCEVSVVCLTRGEGGPTGGIERSGLGVARELEMRASCQILGVNAVHFLGHIDPVANKTRIYAPKVSVSKLARQILGFTDGVDLIISHGSNGEYWHPGHLKVFDAVRKVVKKSSKKIDWMTCLARQPNHEIPRLVNWDDEAHYHLDVSSHQIKREDALSCHKTQLALFGRFAGGDFRDFIRKTRTETFCLRT